MIIFAHIFFAFSIIMIGSDFAAMDGRMSRELDLPGSGIIPFIPWIALGIYILVVLLTRKNERRTIRIFGIIGGYLFASVLVSYPNVIFGRFSSKIKTSDFLPREVITEFEQTFLTPTVHYSSSSTGGPWLVVPKERFDQAMIDWVKKYENRNVEQTVGENAPRPTP